MVLIWWGRRFGGAGGFGWQGGRRKAAGCRSWGGCVDRVCWRCFGWVGSRSCGRFTWRAPTIISWLNFPWFLRWALGCILLRTRFPFGLSTQWSARLWLRNHWAVECLRRRSRRVGRIFPCQFWIRFWKFGSFHLWDQCRRSRVWTVHWWFGVIVRGPVWWITCWGRRWRVIREGCGWKCNTFLWLSVRSFSGLWGPGGWPVTGSGQLKAGSGIGSGRLLWVWVAPCPAWTGRQWWVQWICR